MSADADVNMTDEAGAPPIDINEAITNFFVNLMRNHNEVPNPATFPNRP